MRALRISAPLAAALRLGESQVKVGWVMMKRPYYSVRRGRHDGGVHYDLPMLQRLLRDLYRGFQERCYFQQAFGYYCVDAGNIAGELGSDIEAQLFLVLRKSNLWPIEDKTIEYSEDDCFDIIEFS